MNTLYLPLEPAKRIAPILQRLGVEPDAWWKTYGQLEIVELFFTDCLLERDGDEIIPSFRLDKLLSVLPDWVIMKNPSLYPAIFKFDTTAPAKMPKHRILLNKLLLAARGQPALEACASLIELLDENGLLEEKKDECN